MCKRLIPISFSLRWLHFSLLPKVWTRPCLLHADPDSLCRWTYDNLLQVLWTHLRMAMEGIRNGAFVFEEQIDHTHKVIHITKHRHIIDISFCRRLSPLIHGSHNLSTCILIMNFRLNIDFVHICTCGCGSSGLCVRDFPLHHCMVLKSQQRVSLLANYDNHGSIRNRRNCQVFVVQGEKIGPYQLIQQKGSLTRVYDKSRGEKSNSNTQGNNNHLKGKGRSLRRVSRLIQ